MKLLRIGEPNKEIVAALDKDKKLRDLSDHIQDLSPHTLNESNLKKLQQIDLYKLKEIDSHERVGSCISNPVDFFAIGLNYKAHAEGTNSKLPNEHWLLEKKVKILLKVKRKTMCLVIAS